MFTKRLLVLPILFIGWYYHSSVAQESTTLKGHEYPIWSLAFSPDGKTLCSGGDDQLIIVWDLVKGRERFRIPDQDNFAARMVVSNNGKNLFYAGTMLKVLDLSTKQSTTIYKKFDNGRRGVAISPNGWLVATGGPNNTVRIRDLAANKEMASLAGHSENIASVAFSPNGKVLASGSFDGTVRLWDLDRKLEISRLACGKNWMTPVVFSTDGDVLVSGSDGDVIVWDFKTRWVRFTLAHDDAVPSAAISPNGKVLATACANREVKLWNLATGKELFCTKHSSMAMAVAFSPDGKFLAIGGGHIIDGGEPCEIKLINVPGFVEGTKQHNKKHR
jgi:WD40 repeat protein